MPLLGLAVSSRSHPPKALLHHAQQLWHGLLCEYRQAHALWGVMFGVELVQRLARPVAVRAARACDVSIRQHTSAYVSILQPRFAYGSIKLY